MSAFAEIYDLVLELIDDMSFVRKQIGDQKAALARRILITQIFSQSALAELGLLRHEG
jgi:hypothetical protein